MKSLHQYLTENIKSGVIDFSIRAEIQDRYTVKFYIHPSSVSGDTEDYLLWQDLDGCDFLIHEGKVPKVDTIRFREQLKQYIERKPTP